MGADTVDYRKFNSGSFNPDWRSQPAPINFYGLKLSLSLSSNFPSLNSSNFTGQHACTWPLWWLQKWQGLSWRHLKDSRCIQHMLSPAKSACFQPVLRKFSSNNDSSLWMITVLTQFFFLRLVKKLPGQGAIRCKTKLCSQQPTNILAFKAIFHYFFTKFDTSWHACLVSSFDSINANIFFCKFITS